MIFHKLDIDTFYPRSFELSERNEFEDFLEDFKFTKAISILKQFALGERQINEDKLDAAINICERKLFYFQKPSTEENEETLEFSKFLEDVKSQLPITEKEWYYISEEDMTSYSKEIEKLEKMNKIGYSKPNKDTNMANKLTKHLEKNIPNNQTNSYTTKDIKNYQEIISSLLTQMEEVIPQFKLNGSKNIWILKPSGLSRGRGITCLNSLNEILDLIKKNSNQYIAQKYIENPIIILRRKFDIRQWVLVTDTDPLTMWMYDTPYLRFGAEDYKLEEFANVYSHLTNNSVVKYSKKFTDSSIDGNMWECSQFSEYLNKLYGYDVWKTVLQEKIRKIVICSFESVKHLVSGRKNSHELYGYDIMIDLDLNAWLIESVTEKLVKQMSEDLIKVVVDYNSASKVGRDSISTGLFVKIHEGEKVDSTFLPNN